MKLYRHQNEEGKYNYFTWDGMVASPTWFTYASDKFIDGFALVSDENRKCNFIGEDGHLLSDAWFEMADEFSDGYALVLSYGKTGDIVYNFIGTDGHMLSSSWFDMASKFKDGKALIYKDNLGFNLIKQDGKFVYKEWKPKMEDVRKKIN